MTDASILLRMSEHYETLTIANRKALALFRSELRQFSLNGPISTRKSAFASAQQTKAMSTINERSKAAEMGSEVAYSVRKVPEDLQVLFEDNHLEELNSVQRDENLLQKMCSNSRGWTITATRESLVSYDRLQPTCTDFEHD